MIHNMTGGGAGLNLKVIGGTSRPNSGDTLTWDGNTEGLESVSGVYSKVSDAVPAMTDLASGATVVLFENGASVPYELTADDITDFSAVVPAISLTELCIVVLEDNVNIDGMIFPTKGLYFIYAPDDEEEIYVSSLTIPGYTGFGGSVKNNTIWVNTETDINGYAFSADAPTNPVEGMVWIKTATESTTPINVDKKNTVILYPQTAQQYAGGAWVGKTAQVHTDGAWHELWDGYYYKLGETYEAITGGYETTVSDNTGGTNNGLLTFNSNNMVLSPRNTSTQGGNMATSVKPIDVTNVDTLIFDCQADGNDECTVGVTTQKGVWGGDVASKKITSTARANVSVDVSKVTGNVYILLKAWWNSTARKGKLTVYNIYKQ